MEAVFQGQALPQNCAKEESYILFMSSLGVDCTLYNLHCNFCHSQKSIQMQVEETDASLLGSYLERRARGIGDIAVIFLEYTMYHSNKIHHFT